MVARPSCACGAAPALPKKIGREELEELTVQTKLKPAEVKALYARFRRLAPSGYLLPEQFKQTMGVLGLSDDPFLPDRMFRVFDSNGDGKLSFFEFASSLAVMIRGTEDEKLKLSFEMTAGHRGASGIMLEDFQRLVSACNTMMSALVDTSRSSRSNEDVTRIFHELASSGDESEAVISLEAYKNAVQNSEDFLTCLGLEPRPLRKPRGNTTTSVISTPLAPVTTLTPPPPPLRQEGQVVISASQLEDLRAKVSSLRRAAQRHRTQSAPWFSCTPPQAATPPSCDDSDERWWIPICSCTPRASHRATSSPSAPPSIANSMGEVSVSRNPFDEVCEELDGIIGWCADCSEANHNHASPGRVAPGACSSRAPALVVSSREAPSTPPREVVSLDASRDIPVESVSRPHVHALGAGGKSAQAQGSGNPMSNMDAMQSRVAPGRPHSASGHESKASSSRAWRRHHLLGPKKGLAVHFGHENWNMVLSMMIGIRMSVGRTKGEMTRELQPVDFIMKEKFTIIPRLANIFDSAVSKRVTLTRFMDYAPLVFQRIRSSFGISHDDYLRSVGPDQLLGNMVLGNLASLSELSSEGKSGAFFYYTADGKYMMKTVTRKEHTLLKKMLKRYYDHIMDNPGTLIVRFLGLHSLRVHKERKAGTCMKPFPGRQTSRKVYFVVMGNMFNTPFEIHRRYDLKGSWIGRITPSDRFDPSVALKDVDFQQANEMIRVGEERKARLIQQIEDDSAFLRDNNIIDYSLLLGIYDLGTAAVPSTRGGPGEDSESISDKAARAAAAAMERPPTIDSLGAASGLNPMLQPGSPMSAATNNPGTGGTGACSGSESQEVGRQLPIHQRDMGGLLSSDKKSLYFFGIIDILTPYDSVKMAEHHFKAMCHDRRGVSCCPPGFYASRFNEFLKRAFV